LSLRSLAQPPSPSRPLGWLILAVLLLALRLPHLTGPLDDPHSWRQCDTAHYSLDFYRHGIDLLRPAVCWLGAHRTLVLECPLPEALSALLYRVGGPDPLWDRLVSLAFFVVAAGYFHAFAARIAPGRVARLATLTYLALPLGQYYSRAAQPDFVATAFVHALLFHAAVALERRSLVHACVAAASGSLGVLIKAPCLLPVLGPLALAALATPGWSTAGLGFLALGAPAVVFALWRRHADAVNAAAPDWYFLPGYYKESNAMWWYVGSLAQRLDPHGWVRLARSVLLEVLTPLGAACSVAALGWREPDAAGGQRNRARWSPGALAFALAWVAGGLVYLVVFFPLNRIHDYYQIAFLAPAALIIGLGADWLWQRLPRPGWLPLGGVAFALFLAGAVWAVRPLGYYRIDWLRVEAGRAIQERIPAGDLLIVADHNSGHSDPRLLFRADRAGWPLAFASLTPSRLDTLAALGARWAAVVTDPGAPTLQPPPFLAPMQVERRPLAHDGSALGTLWLYRLDRERLRAAAAMP